MQKILSSKINAFWLYDVFMVSRISSILRSKCMIWLQKRNDPLRHFKHTEHVNVITGNN